MKNLLLIMTDFYGYNEDIIQEIENKGYKVTWFQDKIKLTTIDRILFKFHLYDIQKKYDEYFQNNIEKNKNNKYDEILIVFGANFIKPKHIQILKRTFKDTEIVYYSWDSVSNFPAIKDLFENSDRAYTFDYDDARKYNVGFLPLFYVKQIQDYNETTIKYDVSSVMSFFEEKYDSVNKVLSILPDEICKFIYLKLRDRFYLLRMRIKLKKRLNFIDEYFRYEALSREDVRNIFMASKAVMDCPLPKQNGLTMRTFETLALEKKLITTNTNIKHYPFYTPKNIYVVTNSSNNIPIDFFNSPFDKNFKISEKYSISNFIDTLLGRGDR